MGGGDSDTHISPLATPLSWARVSICFACIAHSSSFFKYWYTTVLVVQQYIAIHGDHKMAVNK